MTLRFTRGDLFASHGSCGMLWQPKSRPAFVFVYVCFGMSNDVKNHRMWDITAKTLDFCMSYLSHVHLLAPKSGILNEQPPKVG